MPLRHVCWLLLAVIAGAAIGFRVGLPTSNPAVSAASVEPEQAAVGMRFAAAGGRRPVKPVGLFTGRTSSPGLQPLSGVEAQSLALSGGTDTLPADDSAATAYTAPYARELTFMAFPSGTEPPAATTPTETAPATPSGPPPSIDGVQTVALTPFSATLSWRTSEPATSRVVYGLDAPVIWSTPTTTGTTHELTVGGLTSASAYHLDVTATTPDGRSAVSQFLLTTPALGGSVRATTANGAILLNGQPAFPKIVWDQCPDAVATSLAVGIDLFMQNGCGSSAQLASWLSGSALAVGASQETPAARAGTMGTYLPDEWDTHLPNDFTAADAFRLMPPTPGSGPRFLTLTNHFYSLAAPLPQGRGMYPGLVASADVLGFDLYPLQNWCRFDSFHDVFDSQLDLVALARGKPTFQWIEARRMDCMGDELDPTPATLRAEAWLSIGGGAHAIGYFPNNWSADVGAEIARVNHEISTLVPALVEPSIAASASLGSTVKVGAREHNGAVYVIAVNASRTSANATITIPALVDRTLVTLDGRHKATADDGAFSASFAPLEARIYIAAPA
ncbi:MAG: fibronectin type III domain-containing protein [Gaiellaceae bacterium]